MSLQAPPRASAPRRPSTRSFAEKSGQRSSALRGPSKRSSAENAPQAPSALRRSSAENAGQPPYGPGLDQLRRLPFHRSFLRAVQSQQLRKEKPHEATRRSSSPIMFRPDSAASDANGGSPLKCPSLRFLPRRPAQTHKRKASPIKLRPCCELDELRRRCSESDPPPSARHFAPLKPVVADA